jgi:hypothetical protein
MSKRAVNTVQGEHHGVGLRPEHHGHDGGTGLGHQAHPNWPAYGAHGHHIAIKDFTTGIRSQRDAFAGAGNEMSRAGTDPTGQSGGTMISNMISSVM